MNSTHVSVVIPYYQNDKELLPRCLYSILEQDENLTIQIIIVDDDSPYPAIEAVKDIQLPPNIMLRIDKQKNQGAAIARNRGLDLVPESTDYVAFLDSDDYWRPAHLKNAVSGLNAGHDIYFCSKLEETEHQDLFSRLKFVDLFEFQSIRIQGLSYGLIHHDFITAILKGFVITSTIVYRFPKFKNLRFPTEFYRFGEDQFFFTEIAFQTERIIFSQFVGTIYGKGVSIYSDQSFGTTKDFLRIRDEIVFRKKMKKGFKLNEIHNEMLAGRLEKARHALASTLLHKIRRKETEFILVTFRCDPLVFVYALKKGIASLKSKLFPQ